MSDDLNLIVRFLAKLAKKGKGGLDLDVAREAFALMEGWSIEDVCVPLEVFKSYDARRTVKERIPDCRWVHRDYDQNRRKELKTLHLALESADDIAAARARVAKEIVVVSGAPSDPIVGCLYATEIGATYFVTHLDSPLIPVGLMWIGVPGWRLRAPSGATVTVTSQTSIWTFLYKHGIDAAAKQALDALGSDVLEQAAMTKAERERVLAAREHLPEVAQIFRDMTEKRFAQVVAWLTAQYIRDAQVYVELRNADDRSARAIIAYVELYDYDRTTQKFFLKPDHETAAAKIAERNAELARQGFVFKNTDRISAIAKRKKQTPAFEVLSETEEGVAGYGGDVRFSFADGSTFILRNKTIWKTSSGGVYFAQFPTTFHQVVMPDGSAMPAPASEERMLDVFSGLAAAAE